MIHQKIDSKQLLIKVVVIFSVCLLIFFFSKDVGFFWDNVLLCSKMSHHLYNTNLFNIYIPDELDPGHPPLMAFIQAFGWKLFGKNLFVSHLIMMPFVFGFIWQLLSFISHFTCNNIHKIIAVCFCLSDPTILSQLFLVAPEVVHLFLFLLAINSIICDNKFWKSIALFFLGIVSFRGMMICCGVLFFDLLYSFTLTKKSTKFFNKNNILAYTIGSSAAMGYIVWRLINKGWMQTHQGSQWEDLWHFANIKIFVWNLAVLIHRYLDFGRVFIFVFLVFSFIKFRKKIFLSTQNKTFFSLAILSTIVIIIVSLCATNTIAHRYFAISYLFIHLLSLSILQQFYRQKILIFAMLFLTLITGNLCRYPNKVAQGWDASLKFIPYFKLRENGIGYLNQQHINVEDVGTFFPNSFTFEEISLNNDNRTFANFSVSNKYVFYSNVYNLSKEEYVVLENNFIPIKQFSKKGIEVIIYKNKTFESAPQKPKN